MALAKNRALNAQQGIVAFQCLLHQLNVEMDRIVWKEKLRVLPAPVDTGNYD